ncbi:MAG: 16S rRNA (cytosine(967)-C(5))-methyltransferase RsmB [Methylomonas sp.]
MNLRRVAAHVVLQVLAEGQSLTKALAINLPKLNASQDRAFVQALCFGVIRHYFELNCMLKQLLAKPLKQKDADIKALLLTGLYQLRYMRVKPHAAVSETVEAAAPKSWAKSLVNAVLRQYLRDKDTLLQAGLGGAEAHYNHPAWMIKAFAQCWPGQSDNILAANLLIPPMAVRVNLLQGGRDAYLELLNEQGIGAQAVDFCDTALILDEPLSVEELPGFEQGRVSVQDVAAQLAAGLLDVQTAQHVLDLCAAPGGKTAAILERQPALRSLLAVDADAERLKRVADNLRRLNLSADMLAADALQAENWAQGRRFDRILLDAPCSGTGVIRRHPDIKVLRRETDIDALHALQSQILAAAWRLLTPGGILLYATCSVLKAENERQIAGFLDLYKDAYEIPIQASWGEARPCGRQILSGESQMDGFYYAKLGKSA